jgi:hypothetical protein
MSFKIKSVDAKDAKGKGKDAKEIGIKNVRMVRRFRPALIIPIFSLRTLFLLCASALKIKYKSVDAKGAKEKGKDAKERN